MEPTHIADRLLVSLDVETACAQGCIEPCEHALDPYRAKITVAGVYYRDQDNIIRSRVFRNASELGDYLGSLGPIALVGQNFKFDLKMLKHAWGLDLMHLPWYCTQILSTIHRQQIPEVWLARYEKQRKELNKDLPSVDGREDL